jgi:hypothetical protein
MKTSDLREDAPENEGNEEDEDDNSTICDEDNDSIGKAEFNSPCFKRQLILKKSNFEELSTFMSPVDLVGSLG